MSTNLADPPLHPCEADVQMQIGGGKTITGTCTCESDWVVVWKDGQFALICDRHVEFATGQRYKIGRA